MKISHSLPKDHNKWSVLQQQRQRVEIGFVHEGLGTICRIYPKAEDIVAIFVRNVYSDIVLSSSYQLPIDVKERRIIVAKPLLYFEEILSPIGFVRVHKSCLINITKIALYQENGFVHVNGWKDIIRVSEEKRKELKEALQKITIT